MKSIFTFMALFPLAYGAMALHAHADQRVDLKQMNLVEIQDTADNRLKYSFLKDVLDDDSKILDGQTGRATRIFLGEVDSPLVGGNMTFVYVDGPYYCGMSNCEFAGFKGSGEKAQKVIDISAPRAIFVQTCGNELSLIFASSGEPERVGKWTYNGTEFEYKENYDGIKNLPECKK